MDTPTERFDLLLVGSGQATGTLIAGLPEDVRVAVVEGGAVGGTCVNTGCTPTKTLVASARAAQLARRADAHSVATPPSGAGGPDDVGIDFAAVMARMNEVRHASRDGLTRYLAEKPNVTLVRGWARFVAPRTVRVGERTIAAERVVLNVGARAVEPPIPGLGDVPWLDNARVLDLDRLPEHLVVIGASYVALELGQVFRRFGARVTVIEAAERVLGREDEDVAAEVRAILEREGIRFEVGQGVARVATAGDGVSVRLEDGREVVGSHLLVATGRLPNSDRLDLHLAGVATDDRGYVTVDDRTRTSAEGVYAVGDVNGRGAFTHTSVHDAQVLLDQLNRERRAGGPGDQEARTIAERDTVYALFTDPPLGRVGLSESQARAAGHRVLRAVKPMRTISRAKEMGETQGFVKVLVDADTDRFLGAAVLGVHGDEVVGLFALAMSAKLTTAAFRRVVLPHPTVGELMPWVLDALAPLD
jgi:pyruvate/2-oxoglutarate dehydrogenase complex dihydrolipoamide dehydrogenase (E3) component